MNKITGMTHFNYKTGVYRNNGVPTAVGSCQKKTLYKNKKSKLHEKKSQWKLKLSANRCKLCTNTPEICIKAVSDFVRWVNSIYVLSSTKTPLHEFLNQCESLRSELTYSRLGVWKVRNWEQKWNTKILSGSVLPWKTHMLSLLLIPTCDIST